MKKREADFGTLFRHWLKANQDKFESAGFELKQTRTNRLRFDAVVDHQIAALDAVQQPYTGLLYKAPDDSRGIKPFDFFYLKDADGWIVIRYPDFFCVIDIDDFRDERNSSKEKSLTSERAKYIATWIVIV